MITWWNGSLPKTQGGQKYLSIVWILRYRHREFPVRLLTATFAVLCQNAPLNISKKNWISLFFGWWYQNHKVSPTTWHHVQHLQQYSLSQLYNFDTPPLKFLFLAKNASSRSLGSFLKGKSLHNLEFVTFLQLSIIIKLETRNSMCQKS